MSVLPTSPGKIIKFLFLCLIVGMVITFFGITPRDFWDNFGDLANSAFDALKSFLQWGMFYIAVGIAVVGPIYLGVRLYKHFTSRRRE